MNGATVRDIAASPEGRLAAAVDMGQEVFVWDLAARREIRSFRSVFESGGRRLAVSDNGLIVAAAYRAQGVACYDSKTGRPVWERKDLRQVQCLSMSASSQFVYVGFENGPCKVLWTSSGYTAFNMRGVRDVFESAYGPIALLDKKVPQVAIPPGGKRSFTIERCTFAILGAAFSPAVLAITESLGPTRGFDLNSGRLLWMHQQPGHHILRIGYSEREKAFFGIECRQSGDKGLIRFEADTGRATAVCNLGPDLTTEFCLGGEAVLKSNRQLVDVASGTSIGMIARE
jgi:hypothetical protein